MEREDAGLSLSLNESLHDALRLLPEDASPLDVATLVAQLDGHSIERHATERALAALVPDPVVGDAEGLGSHLGQVCGFGLNVADFGAPENSYLDAVVERRRGIPISLALVYMHVGAACGLDVSGISFPGHFLCAVGRDAERQVLDPAVGILLTPADCEQRLQIATGGNALLLDESVHLAPATAPAMALRMLANLRGVRIQRKEWFVALALCDAALARDGNLIGELHDRAMILERLGDVDAALRDLRHLLSVLPASDLRRAVQQRIAHLGGQRRGGVH